MSDFSLLNIFKSQAKQLAHDQGLKLSAAQKTLARQAGFADYHEFSVVAKRNPKNPRLMMAVFGVKDFSDAIYEDGKRPPKSPCVTQAGIHRCGSS